MIKLLLSYHNLSIVTHLEAIHKKQKKKVKIWLNDGFQQSHR